MKRISILLSAFILIISLVSCGNRNNSSPEIVDYLRRDVRDIDSGMLVAEGNRHTINNRFIEDPRFVFLADTTAGTGNEIIVTIQLQADIIAEINELEGNELGAKMEEIWIVLETIANPLITEIRNELGLDDDFIFTVVINNGQDTISRNLAE